MSAPNIATERMRCDNGCRTTSRAVTRGKVGDVRQCPHGQVFKWALDVGFTDIWSPLSWFFEPINYRRAARALRIPGRAAS